MLSVIKNRKELEKIVEANKEKMLPRTIGAKTDRKFILVCGGTGHPSQECVDVAEAINREIQKDKGLSKKVEVIKTGNNAMCELETLVMIYPDGVLYTEILPGDAVEIVESHLKKGKTVEELVYHDPNSNKPILKMKDIPFFGKQEIFARNYAGLIDPEQIEEYIAVGGYDGLLKAVSTMKPEDVVKSVMDSGLRGRGGGGFPSGLKWQIASNAKSVNGKKYVVCNADEGDPGAFMDRSQLEDAPHTVIEGMALAGFAIGASKGYIYCRAEYPLAIDRLDIAIQQARSCGLLGTGIGNSTFEFDIEIRMGAGAFVCGEETALINSIHGLRGEPWPKPPFPAQKGVWESPTLVNNVETFGNIPPIIRLGSDKLNAIGTEKSKGTKIFALAGAVKNVGLIEVPMGITLGEIVFDIGGGILGDKEFKAAQIGGPSGGCLPKSMLNVSIDYESLKQAGAMMGSGGLIVMSEDTCMVDLAKFFMEFIQDESCGKCPPCRIGTKQMLDILNRISNGQGKEGDIEELISLGEDIRVTAICGLGQTAPNPVLSTIKNFREEYEAHIKDKKCPAGVCAELVYAPCQNACPAGVNVPAFVALTSEKRYEEALISHLDRNPFPIACGLTCTHPCETKCRRDTLDAPLAIREVKRYMTEKGGKQGVYPMPSIMKRPASQQKNIAIIGGGPAGLTAAFFLKRLGHDVTIFEGQEKLGGMMMYGIPEYRYPKAMLNNEIDNILKMGVNCKLSTQVGKDIAMDQIKAEHDAVIITIGGWKSKLLGMANEDAEGIIGGTDFLWMVAHEDLNKIKGNIVVIGGGSTAVDVARTALRLGADKVTLAYRRTIDEMPAEEEEISELIEEGINPVELTDIDEIIVEDGKVKAIRCRKQSLGGFDSSGRKRPTPMDGEESVVEYPCDYLVPAISQNIDLSFAETLDKNRNGSIKADKVTMQTSDPKVFAAGDVLGLANLAVAIGQGEEVSVSIEKILNPGAIRNFSWRKPVSPDVFFDSDIDPVEGERVEVEYSAAEDRIKNFLLVNRGVNWEDKIQAEVQRCLRCDFRECEV